MLLLRKRRFSSVLNSFKIPILTPQLAKVSFGKITLDNGIESLLISDPDTPVTGSAICIEAGSWMDGLHAGSAHFLEHMLFLGTKKYPGESDYERFIYDSNGVFNGYTANDHSMYYFSNLNPSSFDGALDRFSRFFHEPLFNQSCVARERIAVDEEYKKNIQSDGWRLLHVRKALANQDHPFAAFNTGNLETMELIDREYLIQWYQSHYSANIMKTVLFGAQSVDELSRLAESSFGQIPNRGIKLPDFSSRPVYPTSLHGKSLWVEPLKNLKQLHLVWEIPHRFVNLETHPTLLASHVLGHEGKGSILSSLKADGLIEGLSAGENPMGFQNYTFELSVTLTEKGLSQWEMVRHRLLHAIETLSSQSLEKYATDEINYMSKTGYQYQQRTPSMAVNYCTLMRKEKLASLPFQSYFISKHDPSVVQELFRYLNADRAMTTIVGQEAPQPLDQEEKWMGAKYTILKGDSSVLTPTHSNNVALPRPNLLVPDDLVLIEPPKEQNVPTCLFQDEQASLYHYQDAEFLVPEASLIFNIKTPLIRPGDARKQVLLALLLRFANEELTELSYEAASAGLSYNLSVNQGVGVMISVEGYSQKLQTLLDQVLKTLATLTFEQSKFDIYKSSLHRRYANAAKNSAMHQASDRFKAVLHQEHASNADMALAIESIEMQDLHEYSQTLFKNRIIEAFAGGNITPQDALAGLKCVTSTLPGSACSPDKVLHSRLLKFDQDVCLANDMDLQVDGNACMLALYGGIKTDESRVGIEVLSKLIKEPFYSELRTKQQTGYLVDSHFYQIRKQLFMVTSVQSNTYTPNDLLARMELFFENFTRDLKEDPEMEARFKSIVESTIQRLLQPHDRLMSKIRFYNYLTFEEDKDYTVLARRIELLQNYTLKDLEGFAGSLLSRKNKARLAILGHGKANENKSMAYVPKPLSDFKNLNYS